MQPIHSGDETLVERFLKWTRLKLHLHTAPEPEFYFKEREIWWASLGANIGYEQDGKNDTFERPVLVLKKFNKHVLWILPLTSSSKDGPYYFKTKYHEDEYRIILSQLRLVSSKRLTRKIRTLPRPEFDEIRKRIRALL